MFSVVYLDVKEEKTPFRQALLAEGVDRPCKLEELVATYLLPVKEKRSRLGCRSSFNNTRHVVYVAHWLRNWRHERPE